MTNTCSACGRPLPSDVLECPCGGTSSLALLAAIPQPPPRPLTPREAALVDAGNIPMKAHGSWVCGLAAWISQFWFVLLARGVPSARSYALLAVIVQFVLLIVGLYFSAKVLSLKKRGIDVRGTDRAAAIVGLVLSGGTILLILAFALSTSF